MFILIQWDTPYDQRSKRGESDVFFAFFPGFNVSGVAVFFVFVLFFFGVFFAPPSLSHSF